MALRGIALPLAVALSCGVLQAQQPPLKLVQKIPLSGVEGRIDHLTADIDGRRVFIAALGNGTVEAVDLRQGRRAGQIKALEEPQGLLYLQANNSIYVATGGDGMVRSYDGRTLAPLHAIHLGDDADNIRFDRQTDSVVVGYGDGAIAALNLNLTGKTEVPLPAHPESFQFSPNGSSLFVNLPNDQSIAQIDLSKLTIQSKWGHLGAHSNFPMAVDPDAGRIFVACRQPAQLLSLNAKNGSVADRIET